MVILVVVFTGGPSRGRDLKSLTCRCVCVCVCVCVVVSNQSLIKCMVIRIIVMFIILNIQMSMDRSIIILKHV